jgi:hypothetical protein
VNAQADAFYDRYAAELWKDIVKDPAAYGLGGLQWTPDRIRAEAYRIARQMTQHMADGITVNVSNAMRRAAKKVGVRPTVAAIHAFCAGQALNPFTREP